MIILFFWLLFGVISSVMAQNRNRHAVIGFFAGIIFGVFAIIYYLMAGKKA